MAETSLRAAGPDEAATVVDLVNRAYGRTGEPAGWTSEAHLVDGPRIDEERLIELVERPGSVVLVHPPEGQPVACVHLASEQDGDVELGLFSVHPDRQAQGLGRRLLAAAERYARDEMGAERIVMHVVDAREELIAWYERRGYERTGERAPFDPPGEQRSLAGQLRFVVLGKELDR